MQQLNHHQLIIFFLQLSLMLICGRFFGEIAKKLKQPQVVGEIIAGILLGPTILGMVFPEFFGNLFPKQGNNPIALHAITSMSVILLLFIAGLEVELPLIFGQGKRAVITSMMGIIVPFACGFGVCYAFPSLFNVSWEKQLIFALFLGTALSISALPVIARTLMDMGLFKSSLGMLVIASAMIDDFLGWMIFSVLLGMMQEGIHGEKIAFTMFSVIAFALIMITIGKRILDNILPWINQHLSFPGGILSFTITLCFLGAAFTEYAGIHAIFGSFIVGIAVGDSIHMSKKTKEIIHDFVTNIFAPLFFVSIGLKVNFIADFNIILVILILVLAFFGKIVGCGLGAYWGGFKKDEALAVGSAMNARGAMEIILATLALQAGLIDGKIFVALVVMAVVTSISAGYMMRFFLSEKLQQNNEPTGVIILGDNPVGLFFAQYFTKQRIPVLLTDEAKLRHIPKDELIHPVYQGNILEKKTIDMLDLGRYGQFLALSDDDEVNVKACKLFEYELGEKHAFRLISKKEAQSASLSLPENILFRSVNWHFSALQKILFNSPEIDKILVDNAENTERFIAFSNKQKRMVPLFIEHPDSHLFEPVSSQPDLPIKSGDTLHFIDLGKSAQKTAVKTNNPDIITDF